MTVTRLHKLLGKMIDDGLGRRQILVNKETFTHNLEADGAVMLEVCGVIPHVATLMDDDGGTAVRKDGRERSSLCVLIYGTSGEPSTGLTWEATHPTHSNGPQEGAAP